MRPERIETWLDTGTISATLETNTYLLDHGCDNSAEAAKRPGMTVLPPVFIHPGAEVSEAVIGPHVSIGPDCKIHMAVISESTATPARTRFADDRAAPNEPPTRYVSATVPTANTNVNESSLFRSINEGHLRFRGSDAFAIVDNEVQVGKKPWQSHEIEHHQAVPVQARILIPLWILA